VPRSGTTTQARGIYVQEPNTKAGWPAPLGKKTSRTQGKKSALEVQSADPNFYYQINKGLKKLNQ
jgi:hypothetical protein